MEEYEFPSKEVEGLPRPICRASELERIALFHSGKKLMKQKIPDKDCHCYGDVLHIYEFISGCMIVKEHDSRGGWVPGGDDDIATNVCLIGFPKDSETLDGLRRAIKTIIEFNQPIQYGWDREDLAYLWGDQKISD